MRTRNAAIECGVSAQICVVTKKHCVGEPAREPGREQRCRPFERRIGRGIIYHYQFDPRVSLIMDRRKTIDQIIFVAVAGHYDADQELI